VIQIEKETIFKRNVKELGINLFLGAGFSYDAQSKSGKLPLGDDLKEMLLEHFDFQKFSSLSLPQLATIITKNNKGEFYNFLREQFRINYFSPKYKHLDKIAISNIFTLNIDDLVEKIFSQENMLNTLYDVSIYGAIDNAGIDFYKLHGSITYPPDKDLLFTSEELSTLFAREHSKFSAMALKIASKPTLFWGTRMEDANVLSLLSESTIGGFEAREKWIVVTPDKKEDVTAEYFQTLGFNIIRAYTSDLLDYFNSLQTEEDTIHNPSDQSLELINKYFNSNYLTNIINKKHPVRPIESFFSGDDPVWSDVIDEKIIKLSIYNTCLAKAYKNDITFVTGGIGSGKSTILMQMAIDNELEGNKFYFNEITPIKAIMLNTALKDSKEKTYIFIDNLVNNLQAFQKLAETNKYHIICADRDFNYDMIQHIVNFKLEYILDITTLTNQDIQAVCDLVNNTTFRNYNTKMSLFELAYYLWKGKQLSNKIKVLIKDLSEDSLQHDIYEFFTLMTYIRSSGISASMDMLLLYYSNEKSVTYKTIYRYVERLKSLIDDSEHPTITSEQDFFTLRSKLFAELSLKELPAEILEHVLIKFTNNVHKDIIVRYDIFTRKGLDADIAMKAFIDIEKGKKFYEKVVRMDQSEFRYQQYALYLFRKNDYKSAWNQIEKARGINPFNLAIKNTQAFILFQHNIKINDKDEIEVVKETLDKTFETVNECINKDLRKTFHVITYAENAIKYYKKFIEYQEYNMDATRYLDKALEYIKNEFETTEFISYTNKRQLNNSKKSILSIINLKKF